MKLLKKKWFLLLVAVLFVGGVYWWYGSTKTGTTAPRYALATASKDTIVTTVDGTGQVSGDRQLEVKPRVAARVTRVLVKVGDKVQAGQQLVELDRTDALKSVRDASQSVHDAQISLESAKLQLAKTQAPADSVSVMQAQDALAKAQRDYDTLVAGPTDYQLKQAQADVDTQTKNIRMAVEQSMPQVVRDAYDQYVTTLQSIQQSMYKSVQDVDGILGVNKPVVKIGLTRMFSILNDSAEYKARQSYDAANLAVTASNSLISKLSLENADVDDIEAAAKQADAALDKTSTMLSDMADALQATLTSSDLTQSDLDSLRTLIDNDRSTINSKITTLNTQEQSITQAKDSYETAVINYQKALNTLNNLKAGPTDAERATAQEKIKETQAQLDKLNAGTDALDVKISQNSVDRSLSSLRSAQHKLDDANQELGYYSVVAPFDGIVGAIPVQEHEDVSAGTSVLTLLTSQQMATISLNEVDAAKIQVGQKATMTFDAIDGLTMTGEVAQVSPIGTVSQGVVSYEVQIAFDAQDDRVKSGMSVSTSIVTAVKADVLTVPNSAIKTQNEQSYVEMLSGVKIPSSTSEYVTTSATPERVTVVTGLANDSLTEIVSGLKEGDSVVSQTIKSGTTQATTGNGSTRSVMGGMGAMTGGAPPR